jgi:hypothetical protein
MPLTPTRDCVKFVGSVFDLFMGNSRNHASPFNVTLMLLLTVCATSNLSYSQKITNVDFEVVGNTVRINYDIEGCSDNKNFDIKLLLGNDTELTEITRGLSGDVKDVACGSSKAILWDVLSDRDELRGRIYFSVEIHRVYEVINEPNYEDDQESETVFDRKAWSRRSWKADKGYVGGSVGLFAPYQNYSHTPYNPQQNGFFLNTSIGYLPSLLLGISTTVYFYGAPKIENLRITTWKSCGVMIGPLISLPIGNKVKWEVRSQIGYSVIFPNAAVSDMDSLDTKRSGVAYNLSTGLRLNFGKRTCYMLNVEYLSAVRKEDGYNIEHDLGVIGASFGFAFRFY